MLRPPRRLYFHCCAIATNNPCLCLQEVVFATQIRSQPLQLHVYFMFYAYQKYMYELASNYILSKYFPYYDLFYNNFFNRFSQ